MFIKRYDEVMCRKRYGYDSLIKRYDKVMYRKHYSYER